VVNRKIRAVAGHTFPVEVDMADKAMAEELSRRAESGLGAMVAVGTDRQVVVPILQVEPGQEVGEVHAPGPEGMRSREDKKERGGFHIAW
jgi:hypothetical protein